MSFDGQGKFRPQKAERDSDGIPRFSARVLEEGARQMLEFHCPEVFTKPTKTPILEIILTLKNQKRLNFEMNDLGLLDGRKILGRVRFSTNTLYLDEKLFSEDAIRIRGRFTAAHELAHWILHRWFYSQWNLGEKKQVEELSDDESSLYKLADKAPRDRLEWQANVFAAAAVLPATTFHAALVLAQQQAGLPVGKLGHVYANPDSHSRQEVRQLVGQLADTYGVSKKSVEIRLKTLGMVTETLRSSSGQLPASSNEPVQLGNLADQVLRNLRKGI